EDGIRDRTVTGVQTCALPICTRDARPQRMTEPRHRIVVALDLSEYAEIVLEHAIDQAARHAASDLHFLYVADTPKPDLEPVKQQIGRASCRERVKVSGIAAAQ